MAAAISAIGPANITPSTPNNIGNMTSKGSKNIICLVIDNTNPLVALPIEVKKLEVTG